MNGMRFGLVGMLVGSIVLFSSGATRSAEESQVVTADDRTALTLTIYDRGSALVEETRRVRLPASGRIVWRDAPKTLDPTSVQLEGPRGLQVLEERFLYDPLTHERLLKAARGGRVDLVVTSQQTGEESRTEAVLLAAEGAPVFQIGEEVHLGHPGRVVLPRMPGSLVPEPELLWKLAGPTGEAALTARYLAEGFNWRADYVLRIDEASLVGTLSGVFAVTNTSGADVRDASVQLVAGTVGRVKPPIVPLARGVRAMAERVAEAPVADLHRYTVEEPVTVADGRTVRLGFLQADGLRLGRRYEVRGGWPVLLRPRSEEERLPVAVIWLMANTSEAGLGRPLPGGTLRVYVAQDDRPLLFAGEVGLGHTPAGVEEVKLETGLAFDLVAKRRQTEFQRLGKDLYESAWRVTIENHKRVEASVRLVEHIPPQAEIISASHAHERAAADKLVFDMVVPADKAVEVTYKVRVRR